MQELKSRLLIQKSHGSALLEKGSRVFAVLVLISVISLNSPLAFAQAPGSQQRNTASKSAPAKKQPGFFEKLFGAKTVSKEKKVLGTSTPSAQPKKEQGFLQKLFSFLSAPFNGLAGTKAGTNNNVGKKTVAQNNQGSAVNQVASPKPSATPVQTPAPVIAAPVSTLTAAAIIKSLPAGVTYVDLIGKTVIDSNGNVYPAGSGKGTIGTSANKYSALYLSNFNVDNAGKVTTVLGGGVVKSSSAGVLSSSAVDVNSGDITGTLQAGHGGTGQTTFTTGDLLVGSSGALSRLAIGTNDQMLVVSGGTAAWTSNLSLTGGTLGSLIVTTGNIGMGTTVPNAKLSIQGNVGIGYTGAEQSIPVNGLAVFGNVGIGVTTANSKLAVAGNAVFGTGYAGMIAPSNGLLVQGRLGIGTTAAGAALSVSGTGLFGTYANLTGPSNGLAVSGNIGIGTTTPNSKLAVVGGQVIGTGYGSLIAPASGLLIEGLVGIGNTAPGNTLAVNGGLNLGTYASATGPSNGLALSGNIGIGTTTPSSALSVIGGAVIGASFGSLSTATNNLLVEGLIGIGTTAPGASLGVAGNGIFGALFANQTAPANGLAIQGNVGIGTTSPASALSVVGGQVIGNTYGSYIAPTSGLLIEGLVGIGNTAPGNTLAVNGGLNLGTYASATGPSNGLAVSGNIGIGTTTANNALSVIGAGLFSGTWAGATVPTNGLVVEGSVGIGTSVPSQLFQIGTAGNALAFTSTGSLGIGTTTPLNTLDIIGSAQIRTAGAATFAVTSSNRVGIGTTAPGATFSVNGATTLGTFSNTTGPSNGLAVSGNVGIGTTTASSALQVIGGGVFSNTWSGAQAPTNGLIVEGNTGIGTSQPGSAKLSVMSGNVGLGTTSPRAQLEVVGDGALAAIFSSGNVGIGTTATGFNTLQITGSVGIGTTYSADTYKLDVAGTVRATGYFGLCGAADLTGCNQDVAEIYPATEDVSAGDLVAIDSANQKYVKKSQGSYDVKLMGIVSTSPGLVLGISGENVALGAEASSYMETADPRLPAVALSGKVPVKVSTENGAIKVGDYLTSSSVAGVAMKATKAGPVVGQALASYDGAGVGKVLTFVRLGYFNGASLEDALGGETAGLDATDNQSAGISFAQAVLAKLVSQNAAVGQMSDISIDRVAAGVEIITPKLTADTIILRSLQPLDGENMMLTLGEDQKFVIQTRDNEEAITFDSQGNAYFKGAIVATSVKADQIEGLTILTNKLVAGQVSALNEALKSVKQASGTAQPAVDTSSLAKLGTDGGLTVAGPAEFKASSIFSALADFIANVVFRGDVSFLGRATFSKDTAGMAVIQSGADSVRVNFERAYAEAPFVNISVTNADAAAEAQILSGEVRYVVTALSASGFTIKINKAAPGTISFSWTALAVSGSGVSRSTGAAAQVPAATTQPSPTPAPSVEPSTTPAPSAAPSAAPEVSPTPAPSVEPSATPAPSPAQ